MDGPIHENQGIPTPPISRVVQFVLSINDVLNKYSISKLGGSLSDFG
jgi:hypothetical protein